MKRKLALLLAVVMVLLLLPVNVFAATSNYPDKSPSVVPEETLFYERGYRPELVNRLDGSDSFGDGISYRTDGTNLILELKDNIVEGATFRLTLENADWYFNGINSTSSVSVAGKIYNTQSLERPTSLFNTSKFAYNGITNWYRNTFDPNKGAIIGYHNSGDDYFPDYIRFDGSSTPQLTNNGIYEFNQNFTELPYILSVSRLNKKEAILTVLRDRATTGSVDSVTGRDKYAIVVPLVVVANGSPDVTVTVTDNVTMTSTGKYVFAITGGGTTTTWVNDAASTVARDNFKMDELIIKELRLNTIKSGTYSNGRYSRPQYFTLTAPEGFGFRTDGNGNLKSEASGGVQMAVGSGLSWARTGDSYNKSTDYKDQLANGWRKPANETSLDTGWFYQFRKSAYTNEWDYSTLYVFLGHTVDYVGGSQSVPIWDPNAGAWVNDPTDTADFGGSQLPPYWDPNAGAWVVDPTAATTTVATTLSRMTESINRSDKLTGTLHIKGLEFIAEETAKYGEIMFTINKDRGDLDNRCGITEQSFLVGNRAPWDINFEAISAAPILVNGRLDQYDNWQAEDASHKTAKVRFAEMSVNAWWSGRETTFTLPEEVKLRKVRITANDEVSPNLHDDAPESSFIDQADWYWNGNFFGAGNGWYTDLNGTKYNNVVLSGNKMTWNNLSITANKRAKIEFEMWVSIASGFEGNVTLSVDGSGIPQPGPAPIIIATAESPVSIDTKVTSLKIGYQEQATADIVIQETRAGYLKKGKQVLISVSDLVSADMYLSPSILNNVTVEGDLKFRNLSIANSGEYGIAANGQAINNFNQGGGTISFEIDRQSSPDAPSKITVSNVTVKMDRTVPYSNARPYQIIVWGSAIAANYGKNLDQFPTPGIMKDYIIVTSSPEDQPGILNNEVRVTKEESYVVVNGVTRDMPAPAYISTASNSLMVPLRFVSYALGIENENVRWDDSTKRITIIAPNRVLQFTVGSSEMLNNGVAISMLSPDGKPVVVEIKNERAFVPFRAIGDAFGIPISWHNDTNTAVYNEGKYMGGTTD